MLVKDGDKLKIKRLNVEISHAEITKDASGELIIAGYANTSTKDRVGDVVLPSAFEGSLATYLKNPVLLANHDWEDPIGVTLAAEVTESGLFIKARISDSRPDIKTLIREKCLRTFSIGYNELDADFDDQTKTKYVKELELLEISVVTVPANSEAMFDIYDQKADASPAKAYFVAGMKAFAAEVEKSLARTMAPEEVGAVCGYFVEHNGETMKTKELIELLKKSSPIPTAADAKADPAKPADPAPAAAADDSAAGGADPMKQMQAQMEALAQGMAKILEMLDKIGANPAQDDTADNSSDENAAADAAPAADAGKDAAAAPAADGKPDPKKDPKKDPKADPAAPAAGASKDAGDEMSNEELDSTLADLNAAIDELENQS